MAKDLSKVEKKDVKKASKKRFHLGTYLKEMWGEVKKLTWLSWKELAKNTGVVIVVVLAITLVIYVLDFAFGKPVQLMLDYQAQEEVVDSHEGHDHE